MEKKDSFSYGPHTEIFKEHLILSQEVSQVTQLAAGWGPRPQIHWSLYCLQITEPREGTENFCDITQPKYILDPILH